MLGVARDNACEIPCKYILLLTGKELKWSSVFMGRAFNPIYARAVFLLLVVAGVSSVAF